MSEFRKKMIKIFDPTLMSGSEDVFRTNIGAGLITQTDKKGRFGTFYIQETDRNSAEQRKMARGQKPLPDSNDGGLTSPQGRTTDPNSNELIKNLSSLVSENVADLENVQYESATAVPIIRYPARIYGDPKHIENDEQWRTFIYGGKYMDTEYKPMFNNLEFYDHWFRINMPYTSLEIEELKTKRNQLPIMDEINISYEYNRYMKSYENWATSRRSERLIPNIYLLQSLSEADDVIKNNKKLRRAYQASDINFVSLERRLKASDWSDLLKDEQDLENEEKFKIKRIKKGNRKRRRRMRKYLTRDIPHPKKQISEDTAQKIDTKFNNIIFDHEAVAGIFQTAQENKNLFPYYAKISFEAHESKKFSKFFNQSDFTPKFLVALKETFGDNPTYMEPDEIEFLLQETRKIKKRRKNSVGTIDVRLADFGIMLNKARLNYLNEKDDFCFIGRKNRHARLTSYDKDGSYRFFNTEMSTKALTKFLDFADNKKYLKSIKSPFDDEDFDGKYNETIAYRIEKIGGAPTGDSNTQEAIQNFWFANTRELHQSTLDSAKEKDFNFFDTQVKYGNEYTYNVFAYVVVAGLRYEISDQRITRVIAELDESEKGSKSVLYCLEFYDPETGEVKNKLYSGENSGEKVVNNDFMTNSQISNINKYLADFNITVQPSIKIIEIPITSKSIRILDSPPSKAQAMPFSVDDESNRIGFDIEYTETDTRPFPPAISQQDAVYKEEYMFSNNLLPNTEIDKSSVSFPRYLEIFRTDKPPARYEDFDGKLIKKVDLKIENSNHTLKEHIFYDMVDTNKMYYYVFRFVNEHDNPGRPSVVYSASLQDDGGYKYPLFDIYDFDEAKAKNKSAQTVETFKKLINIRPNLQHLIFDEDTYDTDMSSTKALREMKIGLADSPIWNKRFKIRLTSKKTGKKLDLNVTYNLLREIGRNRLRIDGVDNDGDGKDDIVTDGLDKPK